MNARDQNKYILAVDHGSTGLKTSLLLGVKSTIDLYYSN